MLLSNQKLIPETTSRPKVSQHQPNHQKKQPYGSAIKLLTTRRLPITMKQRPHSSHCLEISLRGKTAYICISLVRVCYFRRERAGMEWERMREEMSWSGTEWFFLQSEKESNKVGERWNYQDQSVGRSGIYAQGVTRNEMEWEGVRRNGLQIEPNIYPQKA